MTPYTQGDLGRPLATGRSAEIFDWPAEDDRIVKLFPAGYPLTQVTAEHDACAEATRLGLTPITCRGQVDVDGRPGLVFDRVHGQSLTRLSQRNPLTIRSGARALARTHAQLHAERTVSLPDVREAAADALTTAPLAFLSDRQRHAAADRIRALPAADRVLHMDFHTENVFTHREGYAVIDWQTAMRGDPAADVAATVVLIRDAELWPGTPLLERAAVQLVRRVVLSTYLTEYRRLTGVTAERIRAWRSVAVILRMSTLDVPSERGRLRRELIGVLG